MALVTDPNVENEVLRPAVALEPASKPKSALTPAEQEALRSNTALKVEVEGLREQVRDLSQHSNEMALFGQLSELLQACTSTHELYGIVGVFARDVFPQDSGALYVLDPANMNLVPQVMWGSPAPQEISFQAQDCWSIRRNKPHYCEISQKGLFCAHVHDPLATYAFCIPLTEQGGTLGVLHSVGHTRPVMSEPRQLLAIAFAHQIALALSNLKLKEILREDAIRDPLTGLFNRRFMKESLQHEIQRALRTGTGVGVITFDLDNFKEVNDTQGHAAGDTLLKELANLVRDNLRAEDIACRQGGDEFLLILPEVSAEGTLAVAEDLRKKFRELVEQQFPTLASKVTLSAGVAMYPHNAATPEALQEVADQALYRAKKQGRDRVISGSNLGGTRSGA